MQVTFSGVMEMLQHAMYSSGFEHMVTNDYADEPEQRNKGSSPIERIVIAMLDTVAMFLHNSERRVFFLIKTENIIIN